MQTALNNFYYLFNSLINLVFNDFEILPNVTLGWVCIGILIFGILITSLLNLPNRVPHKSISETRGVSVKQGNYVHRKQRTITKRY